MINKYFLSKMKIPAYLKYYLFNRFKQQIPKEYLQLNYIEFTGTQYIDTGISIRDGRRSKGIISLSETDSLGNYYIIGTRNDSGTAVGLLLYNTEKGGITFYPFNWKSNNIAYLPERNEKVSYDSIIKENTSTLKINGVTKYNGATGGTNTGFQGENNYLIGAMQSTQSDIQYFFEGRIYKLDIYDYSEVIRREFIPAKRKIDNVLGLYDLVSNEFFTNAGSGSFIGG